jgi:transposase-like protein
MPPHLKKTRTSPRKSGPTSRHVIRLKIKTLFDQGFGVMDTTRQLAEPTRKTVSNWFKKFEEEDKADEDIILEVVPLRK